MSKSAKEYEPGELVQMIGCRVRKLSGKPFPDGNKVNTVTGIVKHDYRPWLYAFIFLEHDEAIECKVCVRENDFSHIESRKAA